MKLTDAAKIVQFPPTRYGSKQKTEALVRAHISNNVDLIKSIPAQYFDRLEEDIYQNMISAQRWEVLADKLIETLDYDYGITQSRADLIARDQTSKMNSAFNQDRQESVGVTSYMWQTSGDERVRPTHADNDGQIFDWDSPPEETGHPGNDVNCLLPDAEIQFAYGVEKAYRRNYCGPIVTIVTDSGKTLRATPNHPVLTIRGWRAIGLLNKGDQLVELREECIDVCKKDEHNTVGRIAEIFESLANFGFAKTRIVSGDFHGDIVANGNVDVVCATRCLCLNGKARVIQGIKQFLFTKSDKSHSLSSSLQKFLHRTFFATQRFISVFSESFASLFAHSLHTNNVCFAAVAEVNPCFPQSVGNDDAFKFHALSNRENAFTAFVRTDDGRDVDISKVRRTPTTISDGNDDATSAKMLAQLIRTKADCLGSSPERFTTLYKPSRVVEKSVSSLEVQVYNLQTVQGWYIYNNTILHNCRCVALPQFGELEEVA